MQLATLTIVAGSASAFASGFLAFFALGRRRDSAAALPFGHGHGLQPALR